MTQTDASTVAVHNDDYLYFIGRAVDGMVAIVRELGDQRACARPDLPGANSPYGLLTHCLGVLEYWGGRLVGGRTVVRDRSTEFAATGSVNELALRAEAALRQLADDIATARPADPLRHEPDGWAQGPDRKLTQAAALLHVYEELAQHHGQMQILRDALATVPDVPAHDPPLDWLRTKRGVKWQRPGPDVLPAWVADMDFAVAPVVRSAIVAALDRGDLGYPDWPEHPLAELFATRMAHRYNWSPDPAHVRGITDLIQAVQIVLTLRNEPRPTVIAHTPNYRPFLVTLDRMTQYIPAPMTPDGPSWTWDHDQLERDLGGVTSGILLLVNPHNPTGRVFSRDELERLADLAARHDLTVISDEIHAELNYGPAPHVPFASLGPDAAARTVTVTSATKAFNIAGLRTAVAHVGPDALRQAWDDQPPDLYGATNVLGVEATRAAWLDGDPWLEATVEHLRRQRDHLLDRMVDLPGVSMRSPQAGYLAWLDCAAAPIDGDPAEFFRRRAGVELSPGPDYGSGNEQFARLNFATSRCVLDAVLDRMAAALH